MDVNVFSESLSNSSESRTDSSSGGTFMTSLSDSSAFVFFIVIVSESDLDVTLFNPVGRFEPFPPDFPSFGVFLIWKWGRSLDWYRPHDRSSFQDSLISWLRTAQKKKINRPWNELKITKKLSNVFLSWLMGRSKVRTAKSQVSPKRLMIPMTLIILRSMNFMLISSFCKAGLFLWCRTNTTMTQKKINTLKTITARMGAKNAPKKAPGWDRKQLCVFHAWNSVLIIFNIILFVILTKVYSLLGYPSLQWCRL